MPGLTNMKSFDFPLKLTQLSNNPLVSVIITNYNYGQFLPLAIESVLNQTYKNCEIIIIDDGSTDASVEVIKTYEQQEQKLVAIFQSNSGQGKAFEAGIKQSKGEIICFLDADDYFYPDKIEKVVKHFWQHPDWVQISHYCSPVDAQGTPIKKGVNRTLTQGDVRYLLLKHGKYGLARTSALAYRRQALLQVLPIPERNSGISADTYLMSAVPFYGQIGFINESLMFYRLHGQNFHRPDLSDINAESKLVNKHLLDRERACFYINQIARNLDLPYSLDVNQDANYRTWSAISRRLRQEKLSWLDTLELSWLILQESRAIGRTWKETLVKITWTNICLFFPSETKYLLDLGLQPYLKSLFIKQINQNFWKKKQPI